MQELALLAFLAEAAEPVFAYERVQARSMLLRGLTAGLENSRVADVSFEAFRAVGTVARCVGFAYRSVGREAVLMSAEEEGGEVEGVVWLRGVDEDCVGVGSDFYVRHGGYFVGRSRGLAGLYRAKTVGGVKEQGRRPPKIWIIWRLILVMAVGGRSSTSRCRIWDGRFEKVPWSYMHFRGDGSFSVGE